MSRRAPLPPRAAAWLDWARHEARQPPRQPRLPLWVAGQPVGTVADGVVEEIAVQSLLDGRYALLKEEQISGPCWHLAVPADQATAALNALAEGLRTLGCCGPWRDEQLAVCDAAEQPLATVERGAVRVLGIATRAVHLVGQHPDGRLWVQQRALTKPNNPGLWDTLMGGMVAASDTLPQALARETWEEAGLRLEQLRHLAPGGHLRFERPSREGGGRGYMVERIDWFQAQLPEDLAPCNQDGEVACFECASPEQVAERLGEGLFTLEAGLVLGAWWDTAPRPLPA